MASGSAVSLDTVMISIESDAGKATSNVDKLSSSLNTLKDSMSGGFGNLKKLAKYLDDLRSSAKGFDSVTRNIANIATGLAPLKELSNIPSAKGLGQITQSLKDLPTTFSKISPDVLSNVSRVSNELSQALTPLAEKLSSISVGFDNIAKLADKYGVSVSKVYNYTKRTTSITKVLSNGFKSVGNAISKVTTAQRSFLSTGIKRFDDLKSKIKQIGLSLLGTRTLFTMLRKAVSEYMAMDEELTKYTTNVWRAFGAQLAPAIEYAMYLFKQFVRVIYSVVLALTGIDLISRANQKAMAAWGKSTKDTLGSLQKFDDLNVVEFNKNASGGDGNDLINLDKIDLTPFQKIIDWVKKVRDEIKAAINTGEWYNVGKVFAEGINEGVEYLLNKLPDIEKKLKEIATQFAHFLNGAVENVKWDNIGKLVSNSFKTAFNTISTFIDEIHWDSMGKALNDYLTNLDLEGIVNAFMNIVSSLADGLTTAFLEVDWGKVASKIGDAIIAFFKDLDKILNKIPWRDIGQKVHDALVDFPWGDVWDSLVDTLSTAYDKFKKFASEVTGLKSGDIQAIADAVTAIGIAFATYKIVTGFKGLADSLVTIGTSKSAMVFAGIATAILLVKDVIDIIKDPKNAENIDKLKDHLIALAGIAVVFGVAFAVVKGMPKLMENLGKGTKDVASSAKDLKSGKSGLDLSSMFGDLGKAGEVIAILGGLSLVLNQLTGFIKTFAETGLSAGDGILMIASSLGAVAGSFALIAASSKLLDIDKIGAILVVFGGITAALLSLSELLKSCAKLGNNLSAAFDGLNNILKTLTVFMAALVVSALALGSNPLALIAVVALAGSLSAILLVMKETLPTILDAAGNFINKIAPSVNTILKTIGGLINDIIVSLGKTLPPIINSVGNLFDKVFRGISKVIRTVGDVIVDIMRTADRSVSGVLGSILKFIRELGPAIETFVNSAINATTRLINFVVSGVEYLINTAIVKPINKLIRSLNANSIAKKLGWQLGTISMVSIDRFSPRLATGTNYIPQEGPYYLHKGESVVPKKYNPALGGGTNEETNRKLDALIDAIDNMSFTNVVNIGNETMYKKNQRLNERMVNKYGTINL